MSYKKWTVAFMAVILAAVVLIGGGTFLLDPLARYRSETDGILTSYKRDEMYTNPGVARNYDYDTVIVGTSMVQNTDVIEFNELTDCNMVKLTYAGGTANNMKQILDICFASGNEITTVYWGLDDFQLLSAHNETRHTLPDYLYKEDHLSDLDYLLNGDIMFRHTAVDLLNTVRGKEQSLLSTGYVWPKSYKFGAKEVISSFSLPEKNNENLDYFITNVRANLEYNIKPLIEANQDTEFVFMFVPYSVLYWYKEIYAGTFDKNMEAFSLAVEELLEYDNVSMYFFRNETDITTDLSNYRDFSHYTGEINSYMTKAIANGECKLTKENYRSEIDEFIEFTVNFDYEGFIKENSEVSE